MCCRVPVRLQTFFFAKQHQVRIMSSAYLLVVDNWEMNLKGLLGKKPYRILY